MSQPESNMSFNRIEIDMIVEPDHLGINYDLLEL